MSNHFFGHINHSLIRQKRWGIKDKTVTIIIAKVMKGFWVIWNIPSDKVILIAGKVLEDFIASQSLIPNAQFIKVELQKGLVGIIAGVGDFKRA